MATFTKYREEVVRGDTYSFWYVLAGVNQSPLGVNVDFVGNDERRREIVSMAIRVSGITTEGSGIETMAPSVQIMDGGSSTGIAFLVMSAFVEVDAGGWQSEAAPGPGPYVLRTGDVLGLSSAEVDSAGSPGADWKVYLTTRKMD